MFPNSPDKLTVEYLSSILGKPVRHFVCEPAALQGACSILCSVDVVFEADLTFPSERLYIKFALPDSTINAIYGSGRDMLIAIGAYRKELAFYRHLLCHNPALMQKLTPPVLVAEIDTSETSRDDFLLVMRETGQSAALSVAENPSRLTDIVEASMRQLALMNAAFFNNQDWASSMSVAIPPSSSILAFSVRAPADIAEDLPKLKAFCCEGLKGAISAFEEALVVTKASDSIMALLAQVKEQVLSTNRLVTVFEKAFASSFAAPAFRTLIHGDLRLENMLDVSAQEPSIGIRLIDFQAIAYGHPAYDLSQFIVQSHPAPTDKTALQSNYRHLLSIYYNTLCEALGSDLARDVGDFENLYQTVIDASVYQLVQFAFHMAAVLPGLRQQEQIPDGMKTFHIWIERVLASYLLLH